MQILVVDDEPALLELYVRWLSEDHEVESATTGSEALALLDEDTDICILDRRMPDISGDDILASIQEQELGCRVAIVTAVPGGFDVLDLPFDAYLSKPVSRRELRTVVERLGRRLSYSTPVQRYLSLRSRRETVEFGLSPEVLASDNRYLELQAELEALEEEIGDVEQYVPGERHRSGATG